MPPYSTPIKRLSLVRLRSDRDRAACLAAWFGPHADLVRALPEVVEYTVDVGPSADVGGWDAVATLRFEDEAAMRRSLEEPTVAEALRLTREEFAEDVRVMLVEEHPLVARSARDDHS
jgi:hypothetical protein